MSIFAWGVDGFGRKTICLRDTSIVAVGIMCPLPGCSVYECIDLLVEQYDD